MVHLLSANQNLNNRVIARSPSFDGLLAMTLFQKNKNGDPKEHLFFISKTLVLLTLKPCFLTLTATSSNILFMPVSALFYQNLAPN